MDDPQSVPTQSKEIPNNAMNVQESLSLIW